MSAQSNAPVIYKKVKKVSGGGHHGGAWKVAYADFVTAMMAFFLLMWLLNATTEKQRKGLADYFNPSIPLMRASGGGDGAFGGDSVFVEETLAHNGHGGVPSDLSAASAAPAASTSEGSGDAEAKALSDINELLMGNSGESMVSAVERRQIITEITDEGLVIQLYDVVGEPLFVGQTAEPTELTRDLVSMMTQIFSLVTNGIAIEGNVAAQPIVVAEQTGWDLSSARADAVRKLLHDEALPDRRVQRVTGHADRKPAVRDPMSVRNNRIELILLRSKI
ncbi:MAG: flagellar motor protein MotB [Maritimibacter sp.]